jgi:MFS family permease
VWHSQAEEMLMTVSVVQGALNIAAAVGSVAGPLIIGALLERDPVNGWRDFWVSLGIRFVGWALTQIQWVQAALWAASAVVLFFAYRPPKRHTRYDHLSVWQKLGRLDLPGFGLLTAGLTLLLVGLGIGGALYAWTNGRVLGTMITGIVILVGFAFYEWKGTSTGILHHDLFNGGKRGRTLAVFVGLVFVEGIMLFAFTIFYPQM